ncbi:MAG: hypothetical protein MEQ07_12070 [Aquimonas sp.]|nr:hypothetical protein [Aquimonas sp.]
MPRWSHRSKSALEQLVNVLIEAGFTVSGSTHDELNFGNFRVILNKNEDQIEVASDRGQAFLEFRAAPLPLAVMGHEALLLIGGSYENKSADAIANEVVSKADEIISRLRSKAPDLIREDLERIRESRARSIFSKKPDRTAGEGPEARKG